jgi:hypothetical protein
MMTPYSPPDIELPAIRTPPTPPPSSLPPPPVSDASLTTESSILSVNEANEPHNVEAVIADPIPTTLVPTDLPAKHTAHDDTFSPDFLVKLVQELGEKLKSEGKKLLSVIILQSQFEFNAPHLILQIPQGFKNDTLESELLEIKRFVASKVGDKEYEFEVEEIKKEFINEVPHTLEERKNALIQENPDIAEWIQTLGLHFN